MPETKFLALIFCFLTYLNVAKKIAILWESYINLLPAYIFAQVPAKFTKYWWQFSFYGMPITRMLCFNNILKIFRMILILPHSAEIEIPFFLYNSITSFSVWPTKKIWRVGWWYRTWELPWLKCSYLRSFSSDTCQEQSSEWRAQENERLFIGKSRAVIGWKRTHEKASLAYNL